MQKEKQKDMPQKVAWIKRRGAVKVLAGGIMTGFVVILVLTGLFYTPYDPNATSLMDRFAGPALLGYNSSYLLGADQLGRDVLSRIMAGGQISMSIALMAIVGTVVIGIVLGLLSGYYGGIIDAVSNTLAEIRNSMPITLMIIVALSIIGPSVVALAILMAISEWVAIFRTTRARTKLERQMDYVMAARANGAKNGRIIFKYIMPNTLNSVIVLAALSVGSVILQEASLSYLGVGVARPYPSWGRMVADGQTYITGAWWVSTFPALTIAIVVLAVNLLGDGLRQMWKMEK